TVPQDRFDAGTLRLSWSLVVGRLVLPPRVCYAKANNNRAAKGFHMRKWLLFLAAFAMPVAAQAASAPAPLTKIRFVTDWKAQAEHGGFYEALALGLYKKAGLDVQIIEGGPTVNVPQMLAGGAADFGIGSDAFIAMNLVKQRAGIKAVMAI